METTDDRYRIQVDVQEHLRRRAFVPRRRTQYVFAYTVTIRNTGEIAAQLRTRHWIITDANANGRRKYAGTAWSESNRVSPRAKPSSTRAPQ